MKIVIIIIFLLPVQLFAQVNDEWTDNFQHYQGSYESDFLCKWMFSKGVSDSINEILHGGYCGHISVLLTNDGYYYILLEYPKLINNKMVEGYFSFKGAYSVDSSGNVMLNGEHPFTENYFQIRENISRRKGRKYISNRYFHYKFNEIHSYITKKELTTYCDGCEFYPD